jgi:Lon protease-like protein
MPLPQFPIFPLGVVLYPGTALPLHLFEPRYRQMLSDVRAGDSRFGILTAISGVPERELPPGRLGCVAEVTEVEIMPDGRSNIVVVGRERFALDQFVESDTLYHVASVTVVPDLPAPNAVVLAVASEEVAQHFKQVVKAVHAINGENGPVPPLPDDPAQLAWTIASMIDLDLDSRYRLLAERDPAARLTTVDAVLRKALPELELQAALKRDRG